MCILKISQNGSIRIPEQLRRKYSWKAGDRIKFVDKEGVISLVTVRGRLMTGDAEFKAVEKEVDVHWLPTRRK